jgi:hypothetical protein
MRLWVAPYVQLQLIQLRQGLVGEVLLHRKPQQCSAHSVCDHTARLEAVPQLTTSDSRCTITAVAQSPSDAHASVASCKVPAQLKWGRC